MLKQFLCICASLTCGCCFAEVQTSTFCKAIDFSGCPRGWERYGKWSCAAPASYSGPCMKDYEGLAKVDANRKRQLENMCNIEWPCEEQCERDWSLACPEFWAETASGYCVAPPQYRFEGCAKMISVGSSATERQNIAAACHVTWPCISRCGEDYAQVCPTGWLQNSDSSCQAPTKMPRAYAGPCQPAVTFANVSMEDVVETKKTFAAKCGVEFCAQEESLRPTPSSSDGSCPIGWILVGEIAPHCFGSSYTGPCRPVVAVQDLLRIGHAAFGKVCHTEQAIPPGGVKAPEHSAKSHMLSGPLLPSGLILGQ